MGEHEEWPLPTGLLLNGLLPNVSSSVIRVLDGERWAKAEERTSELIACIQPNQPSENRRRAVADYVQRLIMRCFPCQVFTFGSVPLKTYLPDGDIDVTAFSRNQILRDTWAVQVRDILESEETNENAEFRVKEVQYIQAEVKIIKCLVENIVVDISFNQLGGLCTLCFLEEVDNLINQAHLFKRSIILIKAWCYYESRILGAHHGLISTYALETLVLYIFHIFNNSFSGPLEVLFRFLEFFGNFDWENFCVSLWGPVAVSSLPDINVEPPRRDSGELLLSKAFLESCNSVYAVIPGGLENQGQPFITKHFNVIDPLRINNNLGRSVNKGNFYRIRSAFAFGAKRLAKLLDCPKENIATELKHFFINTWGRHGSGIRPDASMSDLLIRPEHCLRPSNPDHGSDNHLNCSNSKENNDDPSIHVIDVKPLSSQSVSYPLGSTFCDDLSEKGNSKLSMQSDRSQRTFKHEQMLKPLQGKRLFARTRSSPELTDAYCEASSRLRLIRPAEGSRGQVPSTMMHNSHRKSVISETVSTQSTVSSSDDPHQLLDVPINSTRVSNKYFDNSGIVMFGEDHASVIGAQGMQQEEQDLVNMMSSSSFHNFGRHVHMPLNLASTHLSRPISPGVLTSMGYAPKNVAGMFPANIPFLDPRWATNFHFRQGLSSSPSAQYFPGVGLSTNTEAGIEHGEDNFSYMDKRRGVDFEYWHDQDSASNGGFDPKDETLDGLHADDRQPSISGSSNFASSFHMRNSGNLLKVQQKFSSEHPLSSRDDYVESFQHHDNLVTDTLSHERTFGFARYSSASQASSVKSETSSENYWDGSSEKVSRVAREKRGRKVKGKNIHEYPSSEVDDGSRDCSTSQTSGNEIDASITASQPGPTLHVDRHHMPGFEGPMVLGPGHQQRGTNYSGTGRFTFFPTGPPVPFFTVLPVYNCPSQAGSSEPSSSQLGVEDITSNGDSGQNIESSEQHDAVDVSNVYNRMTTSTAGESSEEPKLDILNSDFTSHWQNLEFGRFCQVPSYPGPVVIPFPVVVPPMYLDGRFPWDGPGRPISANANQISQLMSYGHHVVPVNPLQSDPSRPSVVYQRHADELPRYRSGTGTYLPNPNAFAKDRHSSVTRRNNHNHDAIDQADREGNWNTSKSRSAGRSQSRTQAEKSRVDRPSNNENRADRPWDAYRHQPPAYQTQNGPLRASSSNMTYGMYPGEVSLNGSNMQSVVMLSPNGHSHNSGYVSPGDQLEVGSLGPVGYVGPTDTPQQELRGSYEDQRYHRSSIPQSSPDTPSPHFGR